MKRVDGYNWRKESKEDMLAYFTCQIINTQLKDPITPKTLLEPLRQDEIQQQKNDDEAYMKEKFKKVLEQKK